MATGAGAEKSDNVNPLLAYVTSTGNLQNQLAGWVAKENLWYDRSEWYKARGRSINSRVHLDSHGSESNADSNELDSRFEPFLTNADIDEDSLSTTRADDSLKDAVLTTRAAKSTSGNSISLQHVSSGPRFVNVDTFNGQEYPLGFTANSLRLTNPMMSSGSSHSCNTTLSSTSASPNPVLRSSTGSSVLNPSAASFRPWSLKTNKSFIQSHDIFEKDGRLMKTRISFHDKESEAYHEMVAESVYRYRKTRQMTSPSVIECRFCKQNGERYNYYSSHTTKDAEGRVTCPVLRAYVCPLCGATGNRAHTRHYCPKNVLEKFALAKIIRSGRNCCGYKKSCDN